MRAMHTAAPHQKATGRLNTHRHTLCLKLPRSVPQHSKGSRRATEIRRLGKPSGEGDLPLLSVASGGLAGGKAGPRGD